MDSTVSIVKCNNYHPELLYTKIKEAINLAGDINVKGKKVLLKPNILSDSPPEKAITTHPEFLRAVIKIFKEKGAILFTGDSPGVQKPGFSGKKCGLRQIADSEGINWIDFTKEKTTISLPDGKSVNNFTVTELVNKVDIIVSLPKLKTHHFMYYTGAMKNLFGLIPGLAKSKYHVRFPGKDSFADMIVDLNLAVKSSFAILDGITGMEGPGPGSGYPKEIGLILASPNLLALDITASKIIGYDPISIPINKKGLERKYWLTSMEEIKTTGENIEAVKITNFKRIQIISGTNILRDGLMPVLYYKYLIPRPYFSKTKCTKCGDCIRICPADALAFKERKKTKYVDIDYNKCIKCYCCHEICPADAIKIKRIFCR